MCISNEKMNTKHILTELFLFSKKLLNTLSILRALSAIIARLQAWHSNYNITLGLFYLGSTINNECFECRDPQKVHPRSKL